MLNLSDYNESQSDRVYWQTKLMCESGIVDSFSIRKKRILKVDPPFLVNKGDVIEYDALAIGLLTSRKTVQFERISPKVIRIISPQKKI